MSTACVTFYFEVFSIIPCLLMHLSTGELAPVSNNLLFTSLPVRGDKTLTLSKGHKASEFCSFHSESDGEE